MKKVIILTLTFSLMFQLKAQNSSSALYLMPSAQRFSFGNINKALSQAGLPEAPMTFGSGAGGFGTIGQWRIGGEGTYFSGDASRGQNTTSLTGGLGYFYGGYVWQRNKWNIVPAAGIGFGGLRLVATRSTNAASIGDLLETESNSRVVSMGDGFIHTTLGLERNLSNSMFLGLKAAYNIGLSGERAWKANGLTNSISDPFRSFQLSLNIGFILQ